MTEQPGARPIRCHWGRVTSEPCTEPATVEILRPYSTLYCEQHARDVLEELPGEIWEDSVWGGLEDYTRECEEAANQLWSWQDDASGVLYEVLAEARVYLERNELRRARAKLIESGGTPRAVESERERLAFFDESAAEFG
jgi:hypothetical protein